MRSLSVILLSLLGVGAALLAGGAIFQGISEANDRREFPPPGQLVEVGGHALHIHCIGAGSPTVILDHAGGSNSAQWALIQPEVAVATRACAYDRSGFGWSDPGDGSSDAGHAADELAALLAGADIEGPYILVGHSYGAFVSRLFADRHPDEVAGLVLVDPGRPFGHPLTPPDIEREWRSEDGMLFALAPYAARAGMMRLAGPGRNELPRPEADAYAAMNQTTQFWDAVSSVAAAMDETSAEIVALGPPAKPAIVLSAGQPEDASRAAWTALNATLAEATGGDHRVIPELGHMDFVLTRAGATITTEAILDMVGEVRTAPVLMSME